MKIFRSYFKLFTVMSFSMVSATCLNAQVILHGQSQDPSGWLNVWYDDFNNGLTSDWNIEVNGDGGGNNELQYYCEKAVKVENGNLILTATRENYMNRNVTSGRVNTRDHVYFTHGKIEARIKMPKTYKGLWPAFWTLGQDIGTKSWPACGEIDIVEMGHTNGWNNGNKSDRFFNGACHWGPRWDQHYQYAREYTAPYSLQTDNGDDSDYHLFTCEWDKNVVKMYLDGDKSKTYYEMTIPSSNEDNAPGKYFHKPNFIIFNLAVGGNFPGIFDANQISALDNGPVSMYIDWVRVSQPADNNDYDIVGELIEDENNENPETPDEPGASGIDNVGADCNVNIFPNPTSDFWRIKCGTINADVMLYGIDGSIKGHYTMNDGILEINAKNYDTGMYILILMTPNGMEIQRLIKK